MRETIATMGDGAVAHRYVSFHERLKNVSIDLSRESGTSWGASRLQVAGLDAPASAFAVATGAVTTVSETSDLASTAFGTALHQWSELNLSLPFQDFYEKVMPKAQSLVLLLHHRDEVAAELDTFLTLHEPQNWHAWDALLDLVPRMAFDLGPEFLPVYPTLLAALLRASSLMDKNLTRGDEAVAARLVERAFHSAAWLFRAISSLMPHRQDADLLITSWTIVRDVLAQDKTTTKDPVPTMADMPDDELDSEVSVPTRLIPKAHTRRFASEALAHLIRKAPHSHLDTLTLRMLDDAARIGAGLESGVAATWAHSCKTAAHTLHSRTVDLLTKLLRRTTSHTLLLRQVGERVMTALVHHAHATDLVPVVDLVLSWARDTSMNEDMITILHYLMALVGTRKGTRMAEESKQRLWMWIAEIDAQLPWNSNSSALLQAYVTFLCVAIPTARIQDMTGPGKSILQALAKRPLEGEFGVAWAALDGVYRALGDPSSEWRGFTSLALPFALDATSLLLQGTASTEQENAALALLVVLEEQGHLASLHEGPPTTIILRWTKRVRKAVQTRMERLASLLEQGHLNDDVLSCMLAVPLGCRVQPTGTSLATLYTRCIRFLAAGVDGGALGQKPLVLGALVAGLVSLLHVVPGARSSVSSLFEGSPSPFTSILQACASNQAVLPALADLADLAHADAHALPDTLSVWSMLSSTIMDANRTNVHAALRILSLTQTSSVCNVFAKLADVEATPLDVAHVTSRNVQLRHAQREAYKHLASSDTQMQALVWYAIGTLKLNLKPIWAASRETLVALCQRQGEEVWRMSFAELQAADGTVHAGSPMNTDMKLDEVEEDEMEELSDENALDETYALTDPVLSRRLRALRHVLRLIVPTASHRALQTLRLRAQSHVRFDPAHYANELLQLYEQHAVLPEKHSEAFVQYAVAQWPSLLDGQDADRAPSAVRTERLRRLLMIFSEFQAPAKMYDAVAMKERFLLLCAQPELAIQRAALDCLLTWQDPWLMHHKARLTELLNPSKFRDTLAHTDLSATSEQLASDSRSQVMGVLLRLLYGLMMSRRGARTSGAGQKARRAAILAALCESRTDELQLLVDLMLSAFGDQHGFVKEGTFVLPPHAPQALPRKQLGLLLMLGDVLRHLGRALDFCLPQIVQVVLSIASYATDTTDETMRHIRRTALSRIADLVRYASDLDWHIYRDVILEQLVFPRLPTFADDSVQAPSALLDLCRAWTTRSDTLLCFLSNDRVLPSVFAGLSRASIKPAVATSLLDMAERVLSAGEALSDEDIDNAAEATRIQLHVVTPMVPALLESLMPLVQHTIRSNFTHALSQHIRDDLLRKELNVLSHLAPHMAKTEDAAAVLTLLVPLMRHSARAIPERTKTDLLHTVALLLPRASTSGSALDDLYALLARLGSELRSRQARTEYANAFAQLATVDPSFTRLVGWIQGLNAYSTKSLDETDWDKRLSACDAILDDANVIEAREWPALLYHAFYFMGEDDLVLRTNATAMLQRFLREAKSEAHIEHATRIVLPGVRRRLHSRNEAVRKELLIVLDVAVRELSELIPAIAELQVLRVGGDDEANVLINFYHIQTHRRVRALHRLADAAESGALRSRTLSDLFVPLVWCYFLPGPSGGIDMNMANEALQCIRRMAQQLQWSHYYHWLMRFLRELKSHTSKDEASSAERLHVRGVVGLLEAFHFDCSGDVDETLESDDQVAPESQAGEEALARDLLRDETMPVTQRVALAATVTTRVLPPLHAALQVKDEDRLPARLPIIVGAARLAQHLPVERRRVELFKVFDALATALRSKLQSTRDACRDTANQMVRAIGVAYLPDVVSQLRRSLTRGPQLAVCAYTIHHLVVVLSTPGQHGAAPILTELSSGVRDIVEASMEDVFGLTSEDRAAVEYKTKVRELRQSKSMDTFEQVARLAMPALLQELLIPLRGVLATTIEPKTLRTVNECLHRIASGISANQHVDASSFLILCYTLIARGHKALEGSAGPAPHLMQNAHMFIELGLDLLTTALRRSRFDMQDTDTVAKLVPLVKAVGETLYAHDAPVVERGLRAAAALSRCPLPNLPDALPVIQKQMLVLLRHAGGLHSSLAQTTVRALAIVLREGRASPPPTRQLTELLQLVAPELDAPDAQASVFALLRAIVARAFVVPEVYDIMDHVAELLVVSHDPQVRDVCRALYLQFLLDYPQGQGRLQMQLQFLAKHLAYENEGGRRSVLELLGNVLAKFSTEVVSQYAELFFVALVMQLANEESVACRKEAAHVLQILLGVVHEKECHALLRMTQGWAMSHGTPQARTLSAVALRVYDLASTHGHLLSSVLRDAPPAILQALEEGVNTMDADAWRLPYQALQTMQTIVQHDAQVWSRLTPALPSIITLLTYPHAWCRVAACRLLGAYFAAGLPIDAEELVRASKQLVAQLFSPFLDDALTLQVVRNLVFVGKAFARGDGNDVDDDDDNSEANSDVEELDDVENNGEAEDDTKATPPARLAWLFSKLSHAGRLATRAGRTETAPQRVGAVLKWFAAMSTQLEPSILSVFLIHILSPILRVTDDDQAPEDLKSLAQEVQDLVQERVGASTFTHAYAHVKQSVLDKRRERRNARILEAVADPERAAKRRASRNVAKHESRKRKNAKYRYVCKQGIRTVLTILGTSANRISAHATRRRHRTVHDDLGGILRYVSITQLRRCFVVTFSRLRSSRA